MPNHTPKWTVAVDSGGGFTDLFAMRRDQNDQVQVVTVKTDTTPDQPELGVLNALKEANIPIQDIKEFFHGTTLVINTLIQRKGVKVGLITNECIRDSLVIERCDRPDFFNPYYEKPVPFVDGYLRRGLPTTITPDWEISISLTGLDKILDDFICDRVEAIAVTTLFSYKHPEQEQAIADEINRLWSQRLDAVKKMAAENNWLDTEEKVKAINNLPEKIPVIISSNITREWREYERTSTTVLSAYVEPLVRNYLSNLQRKLQEQGFKGNLNIIQSNGGVGSIEDVITNPISIIESGPVSGMIGAVKLANKLGENNVVGGDFGSTTTKDAESTAAKNTTIEASLRVNTSYQFEQTKLWSGYPIMTPVGDIKEVANGGSSISNVDRFGKLSVGPLSAGAKPGPVAYGNDGTNITTTDANLYLGRIDPNNLCGGTKKAAMDLVQTHMHALAQKCQPPVADNVMAQRIIQQANENAAVAIRYVSIDKGHDSRDYTLVAFGGGGGLHAAQLARALEMRKVIIPRYSEVFSALGALMCDIRRDFYQTVLINLDPNLSPKENSKSKLISAVQQIKAFAVENVKRDNIQLQIHAKMRQRGQTHEIELYIPDEVFLAADPTNEIIQLFTHHYETENQSKVTSTIELTSLHCVAIAKVEKVKLEKISKQASSTVFKAKRQVDFDDDGIHETSIYDGCQLHKKMKIYGPAIVETKYSSTIIPPCMKAIVDKYGNIHIDTFPCKNLNNALILYDNNTDDSFFTNCALRNELENFLRAIEFTDDVTFENEIRILFKFIMDRAQQDFNPNGNFKDPANFIAVIINHLDTIRLCLNFNNHNIFANFSKDLRASLQELLPKSPNKTSTTLLVPLSQASPSVSQPSYSHKSTQSHNSFTYEIIQNALVTIADEMFSKFIRGAVSPIISEVLDGATAITDANGKLVATGMGIPIFVQELSKCVQHIVAKFNGNIHPGDVFIANYPYDKEGGITHLNDVMFAVPVFDEQQNLIAWCADIGHWPDIGGTLKATNTEIKQEGLEIHATKLFDKGQINQPLLDELIDKIPSSGMQADLNAGVSAARVGAKRVAELVMKYSTTVFEQAVESYYQEGRDRTQYALSQLPEDIYAASEYLDDKKTQYKVKITITKDKFSVDLGGNPSQVAAPFNVGIESTRAVVCQVFKLLINENNPTCNEGTFEAVEIIAPEGTVFNPTAPAPLGFYYEPAMRLMDLLWKAIATRLPEKLPAGNFSSICADFISFKDPITGQDELAAEPQPGGWGGSHKADGNPAMFSPVHGDTRNPPVETSRLPVKSYSLNCGSGDESLEDAGAGAGEFRGGAGIIKEYIIPNDGATLTFSWQRSVQKPWPLKGGLPGSTNYIEVVSEGKTVKLKSYDNYPLKRGDIVRLITGRGAGYGDPKKRKRDLVERDVINGYISDKVAKEIYGQSDCDYDTLHRARQHFSLFGTAIPSSSVGTSTVDASIQAAAGASPILIPAP